MPYAVRPGVLEYRAWSTGSFFIGSLTETHYSTIPSFHHSGAQRPTHPPSPKGYGAAGPLSPKLQRATHPTTHNKQRTATQSLDNGPMLRIKLRRTSQPKAPYSPNLPDTAQCGVLGRCGRRLTIQTGSFYFASSQIVVLIKLLLNSTPKSKEVSIPLPESRGLSVVFF